MQNNAVYTLFTLPWLPLALKKSQQKLLADEVTMHFPPWRASTLNCRCAQFVMGMPKSRWEKKRARLGSRGSLWWQQGQQDRGEAGRGPAEVFGSGWGDPDTLLPPLHPATINKAPIWAKVARVLPETRFAPERDVKWLLSSGPFLNYLLLHHLLTRNSFSFSMCLLLAPRQLPVTAV